MFAHDSGGLSGKLECSSLARRGRTDGKRVCCSLARNATPFIAVPSSNFPSVAVPSFALPSSLSLRCHFFSCPFGRLSFPSPFPCVACPLRRLSLRSQVPSIACPFRCGPFGPFHRLSVPSPRLGVREIGVVGGRADVEGRADLADDDGVVGEHVAGERNDVRARLDKLALVPLAAVTVSRKKKRRDGKGGEHGLSGRIIACQVEDRTQTGCDHPVKSNEGGTREVNTKRVSNHDFRTCPTRASAPARPPSPFHPPGIGLARRARPLPRLPARYTRLPARHTRHMRHTRLTRLTRPLAFSLLPAFSRPQTLFGTGLAGS